MKVLGVTFAPLSVPLVRRLQTLSVSVFVVLLLIGWLVFAPLLVYVVVFSNYWYVPMLYVVWMWYDRKTPYTGGRKIKVARNFKIWSYIRDYFPVKLIRTAELPPEKRYIFCAFPHGIATFGGLINIMSNATGFDRLFPGIEPTLVAATIHFEIPISREVWLGLGSTDVSEESIIHNLTQEPRSSILIFPGGLREALYSKPGVDAILLRRRMGFIRVALKTGAHLIPMYSFGENECYQHWNPKWFQPLQNTIKKIFGANVPLICGRGFFQYTFGFLPYRTPITTVVGKPIPVPKVESPSKELIAEYHQKFEDALTALFVEYKEICHVNGNKAELKLV